MSKFSEQNRTEQNRTGYHYIKAFFGIANLFLKKIIFIFADNFVGFIRFSKFSWSNPCLFRKNNLLKEGKL